MRERSAYRSEVSAEGEKALWRVEGVGVVVDRSSVARRACRLRHRLDPAWRARSGGRDAGRCCGHAPRLGLLVIRASAARGRV